MRFQSLFVAATMAASSVVAQPMQHVHNHHKREAEPGLVVVTETEVVVVTAGVDQVVGGESTTQTFSTVNTAIAAPISLSTTVVMGAQVADSSAAAATYTPDSAVEKIAKETSATSTSTSAVSTATAKVSTDSSLTQGKGITYSPYNSDGSCKSLSQVKSDFATIDGYQIIRLYGVDCNQVENVFQAKASGQKLFLGIYFMDQIEAGISQIASAVSKYGSWDDVYTVSIGNELVNSGQASVAQVGEYVATGRSALTSAGYSGPVVSVDTFIAVINNPGLCEYSDYIGVNAHAYFDYNTVAADAGPWVLNQIERVWTACGSNKNVFITESGWPHQGDTYGVAVASPEAQASAISSIRSTCGNDVILYTTFDDLWKANGAQNCEKYWGIYSN